MRYVYGLLATPVLLLTLLAWYFLFDGEPDVWDSLKARAMGTTCQEIEK